MRRLHPFPRLLAIALIAIGLNGCATTEGIKPAPAKTIATDLDKPRIFEGYKEFFAFVAQNELKTRGIEVGSAEDAAYKLAAESTVELAPLPGGFWYAVTPHFYAAGGKGAPLLDLLRGMGGGTFYLIQVTKTFPRVEFALVGIANGSAYRWQTLNGTPQFVATRRGSANAPEETIHTWNGSLFKVAQ